MQNLSKHVKQVCAQFEEAFNMMLRFVSIKKVLRQLSKQNELVFELGCGSTEWDRSSHALIKTG